jgi:hypothetical protein
MEKIKLSKNQWEFIGKKVGWIKKAVVNDDGGKPYTDEQRARDERIAHEKSVVINKILKDIEEALQKGKMDEQSLVLIKKNIDQWTQNYFHDLR